MSYRSSRTDGQSDSHTESCDEDVSEEDLERAISEIKGQLRQREYEDLDPEQYTE